MAKLLLKTSCVDAPVARSSIKHGIFMQVYIGELSPAQFRGIFASSSELSLTFGVLFLLALGSIPGIHYYDLALVMVGIVALFICMAPWIPETPRWLLMHSKDQRQAVAVMRCLRGPKYPKINTELEEIKSTIPMSHPSLFQVMRQLLCNRGTLVPFLLLLFVYVYQPASGAAAVYAYVGPIFLEAGVPFPNLTATFSFGGVNVLVTFVSVFLIELIGRKFLLAVSSAGMFAASLLLGTYFYVTRPSPCNNSTLLETSTESLDSCHPHLYPLAILGFIIFAVSFALGLAPVPWVLLSEYLPLSVRGVAGGVTIAASRSMAAVVTGTFLSFSETLGAWTLWWTLTCVNFVAFLMIVLLVKETKGKELEEVQELFVARTCQPTCSAITCKRTCQWCYS